MSSSSSTTVYSGVSSVGLLGVLFVGLKLTGYITWPWIWVLAPFWAGPAILLAVILLMLAGVGIVVAIGAIITFFQSIGK